MVIENPNFKQSVISSCNFLNHMEVEKHQKFNKVN